MSVKDQQAQPIIKKASPSNTDDFKVNERVFIQGLIKANHLNNLIGTVKGGVENSPRLKVLVKHLNKTVLIRPDNISIATAQNEIESILQHLAKDQKCALLRRFSGSLIPTVPIDFDKYRRAISLDPNGFCGCTSSYCVIKYLMLKVLGFHRMNMEQQIQDYNPCDDLYQDRETVIHRLCSFTKSKLPANKISVCLLDLTIYGFERKFTSQGHQISILRINDSFRIVQAFEETFSLKDELDARDWIGMTEMKKVTECILDVVYGKDADSAMKSFEFLCRFKLNVVKNKFKRRDKINTSKITIYTSDISARQFIREGNQLLNKMCECVDRLNQ